MPQQPPGAGFIGITVQRRVVVEPQSEIGLRELFVVQVRVDAKTLKHGARDRFEQRFVREREGTENGFPFRVRPEVLGSKSVLPLLRHVECASTPDPALDQVRMDIAGFAYGEIALTHRAETFGAEAHLVVEAGCREQLLHAIFQLCIQRRIDAVINDDGKADVLDGAGKVFGEACLVLRGAVQIRVEVEHLDLVVLVVFVRRIFGEPIGMSFFNLVVALERLIARIDVGRIHGWPGFGCNYPVDELPASGTQNANSRVETFSRYRCLVP